MQCPRRAAAQWALITTMFCLAVAAPRAADAGPDTSLQLSVAPLFAGIAELRYEREVSSEVLVGVIVGGGFSWMQGLEILVPGQRAVGELGVQLSGKLGGRFDEGVYLGAEFMVLGIGPNRGNHIGVGFAFGPLMSYRVVMAAGITASLQIGAMLRPQISIPLDGGAAVHGVSGGPVLRAALGRSW